VTDLVPAELRGTAFGIYNFTISVTILPASLLMGLLWDTLGAQYAFMVGAGLAVVAMIIFSLTVKEG
jgi:predicted MFS family arabinose efflux permease